MCYVINKSTGETRQFKYAYCSNCTGELNGYFHFVMYRAGFAKLYRKSEYTFINEL